MKTAIRTTRPLPRHQFKGRRSWFSAPEAIDAAFIDPTPSIVLAEDDDLLREIFEMALINRGCEVRSARNGEEAWKLLCEAPFALLITDNDMPGLTGFGLVRRMRAESLAQPAILISGNMPWENPDLCDLLSPGAAIEKPFGIRELISTVCGLVAFQSNKVGAPPKVAAEQSG